jgi:hypothetical protein
MHGLGLQAWTGPEGSRRLWLPDFKTVGTWRWEVCQPYTPATFTPKEIFLVLISVSALQAGRSRVRFPVVSMEFFIDIIIHGFDSASNRNEYQEYFLGGKGARCVGPITLPPSCADCHEIWESSPFPILHRTSSDSMIFLFRSDVGRRPTRFLLRLFACCRNLPDVFPM